MAVGTVALDRKILVCLSEIGSIRFMAGGTQTVGFLNQKHSLVSHMCIVTGKTTLLRRFMNIGLGEFRPVMAGKTHLLTCFFQQLRIGGVVHFVTITAFSFPYRLVHGFFRIHFLKHRMTGKTENRWLQSHQDCPHHPMGQVTRLAVLPFDRSMNNTLLILGGQVRMALGTGFANLLRA